ncbi:MAG TPA: tetratricopeptide repeat protein [Gemmatimonadales bacterium]|jgi:tetratricopeptide (TPR) repeat protein|nr:tetratricopeptide repeat protein [Gemmatimonadales bacterium]
MNRIPLLVLIAALLLSPSAGAQKKEKRYDPARPSIAAPQDSNFAGSYFLLGMARLSKDPEGAAAAFHWARRIDPSLADAFYAERIARHLSDTRQLGDYLVRNRSVMHRKEVLEIDSLQIEALIRNPMLNPRLDRAMLEMFVDNATGEANMIPWDHADPANAAWLAMSEGQFDQAAEYYGKALKRSKNSYGYNLDRALAFYLAMRPDSSLAALDAYLEARRKDEKKEVIFVYQSKAMAEYTEGWVYDRVGNRDKAKEAYGRALTEDLSFAMAHSALGDLAQQAGDTATSLQEYDLAVQLRGEDPFLRLHYGNALVAAGRTEDATVQFEKAVILEPYYALPWLALGKASDRLGRKDRAIEAYQTFIQRAHDGLRKDIVTASERLKALKPAGGA